MKGFLDPGDTRNPTWKKVLEHIEGRIEVLQNQNNDEKLGKVQTALRRGAIKELKRLVAQAEGHEPLPTQRPTQGDTA